MGIIKKEALGVRPACEIIGCREPLALLLISKAGLRGPIGRDWTFCPPWVITLRKFLEYVTGTAPMRGLNAEIIAAGPRAL